ncbi:MAG: Uma2 family endonuclease, partial [Chloroflexi bacterium]|nr:Uma2 family endonuclease [Chloroflexota bacterium]
AVRALLEGDLATVLAELQKGLASDEHSAFVERLK